MAHLQYKLLQLLSFVLDALCPPLSLHFKVVALLGRVGGQPNPADLLLLLGDDVHGHQHVQRIVHTPPDVLLVVRL